jgi:hypothetical protein
MNRGDAITPMDGEGDGAWGAAREAGRRHDEDWPVMRGTPAQRDARFVRKLIRAQLALARQSR